MESLHPRQPAIAALLVAAIAAAIVLAGCERESRTLLTGHAIRARDLAKLTIGSSTALDVERVFGPPDERAPDGSFVYRATAVRRSGRSIAGFSWADAEQVVGLRTAKFRFVDGVLTQVCREHS